MKNGGKELDPRKFDHKERAIFSKADASEWSQWLSNQVVRVLTPEEERHIPRSKIFSAPMRFVRVNKDKSLQKLEPKSRIVIPGHKDPELGQFRTDSPTTSTLAVQVAASIAASYGWLGETFDVSTAFLSGKETNRAVYVRAPVEGLPATNGHPMVPAGRLLEVLKGAYGLAEAPRLWYLRARELMKQAGFVELKISRSVFMLRCKKTQKLLGICTLHVDDGKLYGDRTDAQFNQARKKLDQIFNMKEWHDLRKGAEYLGARWTQATDGRLITMDMDTYMAKLESNAPKRNDPDVQRSLLISEAC
jgi:hypothetical protein